MSPTPRGHAPPELPTFGHLNTPNSVFCEDVVEHDNAPHSPIWQIREIGQACVLLRDLWSCLAFGYL